MTALKINRVEKKIQNYRNKWMQHVWRMDRDRQTGRPLKGLLDCKWERNRSRGLKRYKMYDDDDNNTSLVGTRESLDVSKKNNSTRNLPVI